MGTFTDQYLAETVEIIEALDGSQLEGIVSSLAQLRERGGRLFILGVGGSAGHASHAVNDFRKICGIEAYTPVDNVSELTARINDDGWDTAFSAWLEGSHLDSDDAVLVFSVGGGSAERGVSVNLIRAIEHAKQVGAAVLGIVGRDGGYTAEEADVCVVVPPLASQRITPHTEGLCAVLWHLLVSHPDLQVHEMKWESVV